MEWLARHERLDRHGAALDLTLFHRQVDGAAALVAQHDVELGADGFFEQLGEIKTRAGGAAGAAFGRLAGLRTSSMVLYGLSARM
jgi:hypothetical protein